MVEENVEGVLQIGLGIVEVESVLIGLHFDEPKQHFQILLLVSVDLKTATNQRYIVGIHDCEFGVDI